MIVRGRHYLSGRLCDFHVEGGVIRSIDGPSAPDVVGGEEYWVAPGLIDLQVNGYHGHDFCSGDTTVSDVLAAVRELSQIGVAAFCPTVTTNSYEAMASSLKAIADARDADPVARRRILAVHLEGPYISPLDGPRGAHPPEHVRLPDWHEFRRFQDVANGLIGIITVAPELPGAVEFIAQARAAGILVAIGHHAATGEQIAAAVSAGARMSTHLGNGSHAQLPRHPNYIWSQLANDQLLASIIVDGHHLPPEVVKSFVRVKGTSRLVLISDVVAPAGQSAGDYRFMGMDVQMTAEGLVRLKGTEYLAGSTLRLADAVYNIERFSDASFADAIQMASSNPARLLGVSATWGRLDPGAPADLALFRDNGNWHQFAHAIVAGDSHFEPILS